MLLRKAIRAIWENKRAYIACIVLISIGVMIYISMATAAVSLTVATDTYYEQNNLADVFSKVKGMPISDVERLGNQRGIKEVLGRQVYDSRALIEGSNDIINLRLISDDNDTSTTLNNYNVKEGQNFYSPDDILIGQSFLDAHGLKPGDKIKLTIKGKEYTFNICGGTSSPDYVYPIKDAKQFLSDPAKFNIAYIQEETLANSLNMQGIYNDISFGLESGYTFDDVKPFLEEELNNYGLIELVARKDQISYAKLNREINENKSFSSTIPAVFIIMSIIILYLMLKRVIEQDRTQIGTLKAFGYSNVEILLNYMIYGGITGALGGTLGIGVSFYVTDYFIDMYKTYYEIPNLVKVGNETFIGIGMAFALAGGFLGAMAGAYSILKLSPAEAMRPVAPKAVKGDFLLHISVIKALLTSRGAMAVRSIERNKFRSFFIVMGIMFSFGILAFTSSFADMINRMLFEQFTKIEVYDGKIVLDEPVDYNEGVSSIANVDGVTFGEGLLEVPGEVTHKHRKEGAILLGIDENAKLYKIYDSDKKIWYKPPKDGVIISSSLAKKLDVSLGDNIIVKTPMSNEDLKFIIVREIEQNLGGGLYIEKKTLEKALNTNEMATSLIFNTSDINKSRSYLVDGNNINSINDAAGSLKSYEELMAPYKGFFAAMQLIGIVVAFAIIYNTSTISLSERKREYATLRVMGLQVNEVAEIIAFEYWILCTLGICFGVPFTVLLKTAMNSSIEVESFSMPTSSPLYVYFIAMAGCIIAVFISNRLGARKIGKFDMVEVLKERE